MYRQERESKSSRSPSLAVLHTFLVAKKPQGAEAMQSFART